MSGGKSHIKLVVLGEGRVGKTSLTLRYVQNKFADREESTINASYLEKDISLGKSRRKLAIWDTAGQEKFSAVAPIYYRDAEGAVLVYDITMKESFPKVNKWLQELREHAGDEIILAIVGNKMDKENERQIDKGVAEEYARRNNAKHFETSAKMGKGIEEVFAYLATEISKKNKEQEQNENPKDKKKLLVGDTSLGKGKKKSDCC
jgi:small GTP-binding protein